MHVSAQRGPYHATQPSGMGDESDGLEGMPVLDTT